MLSTKTKEHLRRWAVRVLPKYVALLGGAAVLAATALWVGSLTRVVTVTDSHGANSTIVTAAQNLNTILEQAGVHPMGADDELVVTETDGSGDSLHVLRAFTVPVTADGQTTQVVMTQGTVADALQKAGVEPGPEDWVEPALDASAEGCEVTVTRVEYREYTQPEVIPMQTQQVETSLFYRCKDYTTTVQEGVDGLDVVTYRETWADGELVATEEGRRDMAEAMVPDITKVYGETVPVSRFEGPDIVDGQPVEGVAEVFTSQRATGYSASPTAKGASGRRLTYGTVAVNPNVIPYGSLLYITSDDGRFVYGYAYAADTGTAMMNGHAFIDLYYETYDESVKNAVIPVTVYLLDEETAARYKDVNDALLEADTTPGV